MSEKTIEIFVGTVVLLVALFFLAFTLKVTNFNNGDGSYNLGASFRSAEGIDVGTEVRMAGVKIGSVSSLHLNSVSLQADAEFLILTDIKIPDDSAAVISSEGLLGGSFVEILPGGSFEDLVSGAIIQDTQSSVSLINLLLKLFSGSKE
ncbi:outer membrane lipid asymmetry maintenance protein MlaD [bacterium]|jgi:phospholipid/cholesterol/gamma-HCH transport system substrate-binding protein|nr:outer membrane lipid asymmetry maintenance protein MlaD [bacterium]|tara:strand:- start:7419 stop:7865 length:447 start_codon:yes stop_codon:yes gene_type:complete